MLALFVLVAPIPLDGLVDEESFTEGEVILHRMDDVWMQDDWSALKSFGYTPLRLVTPSALIVWKHNEEAAYPQSMEGGSPTVDLWFRRRCRSREFHHPTTGRRLYPEESVQGHRGIQR